MTDPFPQKCGGAECKLGFPLVAWIIRYGNPISEPRLRSLYVEFQLYFLCPTPKALILIPNPSQVAAGASGCEGEYENDQYNGGPTILQSRQRDYDSRLQLGSRLGTRELIMSHGGKLRQVVKNNVSCRSGAHPRAESQVITLHRPRRGEQNHDQGGVQDRDQVHRVVQA